MPSTRLLFWMSLAAVLVAFPVSSAHAQPKPSLAPSSTHIFPAGGRRGTKIDVLVGAECMPPETRFRMFGKGVRLTSEAANMVLLTKRVDANHEPSPRRKPTIIPITIPREWESSLTIGKDAAPGPVYWRLSCAQGGTELRPFIVGDWPEFIETESNSTPNTAEPVTLPVTVNGRIYGERDNDYFRFTAALGEVVVCEVLADRLKSRLDPIVEILDSDGRPVRTETAYVGSDPVLAFRADSNGEYLLRIANVSHHGDPAHVYRINISTKPFVRSVFPTTGRPGSEREIAFRLMTGTDKSHLVKRRVKFPSKMPADGGFRYRLRHGGSTAANRVSFDVGSKTASIESNDNDSAATATRLKLPVRIDGRFSARNDQDWFRFQATKGTQYTILCDTPPQGSSAIPTLLLTDAKGKPLKFQRAVETEDRFCRLEWKATADGEFRIRVRDQQFGAKGGPEFFYRLTVRKSGPDFELAVPAEFLNIQQGRTIRVPVFVKRFGGFDDPIKLQIEGLPEGVTAKADLIKGKASRFEIALSATKTAASKDATIRIIGRGRAGLTKLVHAAVPKSRQKVGSTAMVNHIQLTVQHRPVFRLFCLEAYQYAHRGSVFSYPMTVERLEDFKGEVTLQVGDRQNRDMDGIEIGTLKLPPGKSEAIVPIYLPETMHINVQSQSQLYSQAYAHFVDAHGNRQAVLVLSEKRNMLRTLPPVVKLKAVTRVVKARPGETLKIELKLERTTNFPGPMSVALRKQGTATAFDAKPVRFGMGETKAALTLHLPAKLAAGSKRLVFRGIGKLKDGTTIISETRVTLRVRQ